MATFEVKDIAHEILKQGGQFWRSASRSYNLACFLTRELLWDGRLKLGDCSKQQGRSLFLEASHIVWDKTQALHLWYCQLSTLKE